MDAGSIHVVDADQMRMFNPSHPTEKVDDVNSSNLSSFAFHSPARKGKTNKPFSQTDGHGFFRKTKKKKKKENTRKLKIFKESLRPFAEKAVRKRIEIELFRISIS